MKAVILAAGRGSRLAPLTDTIPKALVPLTQKLTILDHILASLPTEISEILVVVGHKGEKIKRHLDRHPDKRCVSVVQGEIAGTWGALWSARDYLKSEDAFLVLNGDDIYRPEELSAFVCAGPSAMGVQTRHMPPNYHAMAIEGERVTGFRPQTDIEKDLGAPICTGAYVLEPGIFDEEPTCVGGNEYGLPQTLMRYAETPKAFRFTTWHPINTPCELERAQEFVEEIE